MIPYEQVLIGNSSEEKHPFIMNKLPAEPGSGSNNICHGWFVDEGKEEWIEVIEREQKVNGMQ